MQRNRIHGALAIGLVATLAGCSDGTAPVARQKQLVTGRFANPSGQTGSSVDAYEVDGSGDAVPASDPASTGTIDAQGHFSVEVSVSPGHLADVIVTTVDAATRQAAIVESHFHSGSAVTAEPMSAETTFESDLFVYARAQGLLCDGCSATLLQDFVTASSADANASATMPGALSASAEVIASAADAFHATMTHVASDGAAAVQAAFDAHVEAREARAAALDAATDGAQVSAAQAQYEASVKAAYEGAGIDVDEQASAAQAAAEAAQARLAAIAAIDASVAAALSSDVEFARAAHVTAAVEAAVQATSSSTTAIVAAGDALEASLASAGTQGGAGLAQIDAAWATYKSSVEASLRGSLTVSQAAAFDAVVSALHGTATSLHTTLDASFVSQASLDTWIQPILTYFESGSAQVDALTTAGLSSAEAAAMVKALLAIEFAAG